MERYMSLAQFVSKGNKLEEGRELLVERSIKTKINAKLITWDTTKDDADKNNFGYYQNSKAYVELDILAGGGNVWYPFSMIYIKLEEGDKK